MAALLIPVLDPSVMPALVGRTAGGLGDWQVQELIGGVAEKAGIAGFDRVEVMLSRAVDGQGATLAVWILAAVMRSIARRGKASCSDGTARPPRKRQGEASNPGTRVWAAVLGRAYVKAS